MRRLPSAPTPLDAERATRPLITGEGVIIELHPAGLASRLGAALIDAVVLYIFVSVFGTFLGALSSLQGGSTVVAIATAAVLGSLLLAYPIGFETLWSGRTPGKAAVGLRVVSAQGGPIGFRRAAVRGALLLVDIGVVPIAALWSWALVLSGRGRRLGDLAAGTLVVRERRGDVGTARPIAFMPGLGLIAFRDQLDVGRLDATGYRLVRSVLLRQRELVGPSRDALVAQCAWRVARRLGHQPVPWISAEQYLTCVASAYQLRHRGRPVRPGPR